VNPAAIAKLLIIGLLITVPSSALIPSDHMGVDLLNPLTESAFGGEPFYPMDTSFFGSTLVSCYGDPNLDPMNPYTYGSFEDPLPDVLYTMILQKYHGWIGGVSSIAVIAVGLALFALCRGYIKWRITLVYFVTTVLLSIGMGYVYGGDIILRLIFHLFTGSSIFLAFFMATDPATTPMTRLGQIIFGAGLAILTMIIQAYTGFLGGSILALVMMNPTTPLLDRIGVPKPSETRIKMKLPKAKKFASTRATDCIRCGQCLVSCCMNLSPISIKEAIDRQNWEKAKSLGLEYCDACGHCSYVCPARIDLKTAIVAAKEKMQTMRANA